MAPQVADTFWLLLSAGLVFLMQPGFMCLESGLTRSKSSIDVAIKNLTDFGLSVTLFWAFGYALMYGTTAEGWLGSDRFAPDLSSAGGWAAAFFVFQAMFCGTSVTIVSGAVAERMRFGGYLLITVLLSGPLYTVFGHWVWNGLDAQAATGWLGALGFRDFAGATVVHSVGGWVALAAVVILGPREGRFPEDGEARNIGGHNLPLAILGAFLLWIGWFGFNGGSLLGWHDAIPSIVANTMLAGAGGLLTGLLSGTRLRGRPDVKLGMNGALAGLVSITGGCHVVGSAEAFLVGASGGVLMTGATWVLERWRVDDVVGAVPVHAVGGVWGTLAVALFGDLTALGSGLDRGAQLGVQILGVATCFLWAFGGGYLGLRLIDRVVRLRVTLEQERQGLNVVEHGATTELLELVSAMEKQAVSGDLSLRVDVASHTEVGQIATQYNRVIGALEKAMQDVRDSADRYRRTIEHALDAIVTIDEVGVIMGWNPQAEAIFGWSREEALGQDVFELVTPDTDRDSTRAGLLSFLTTGGESAYLDQRLEITGQTRDGRRLPIEATFTMATYGEKAEFHLFFQDITERRRARRALQQAKESAEQAARARSEFLANMSHEIRTPMNGILGMTELTLDTTLDHQQRQYLEMVKASADSLLRLLNDILDFSRVESGKLEIEAVSFGLRDHLADLLRTLTLQAEDKGLELVCHVDREVPDGVVADPARLGQVLINLVANGIKFAAAGEITVRVRVDSRIEGDPVLEFAVSDRGPGIPFEKQEHVFHAFEQADSSTTRRFGGTGLGLAISKRLVETMGGRIWVDSEPGHGSTFYFTVRVGSSPVVGPALSAVARSHLKGVAALVVDPNATHRRALEEMLDGWGMVTEAVPDAARARERITVAARAGRPYELVSTDMGLPESEGFALIEWLCSSSEHAATKVILVGSGGVGRAAEDRRQRLEVGAYVLKPIKPSALLETLARLFGAAEEAAMGRLVASAGPEAAGYRALVVEDNHVNQEVARGILERWGIETEIAASGEAALSATAQCELDFVLMDLNMPDMDGLAVTAGIRERERESGEHLPIIAMTANVMAGEKERCLAAGMDGFVAKPIVRSRLAAALEAVGVAFSRQRLVKERAPRRASPAVAEAAETAPAFDSEALLRRVDGQRPRAAALIEIFLEEDLAQRLPAVARAVEDADADAIRREAHALKGAAAEVCSPIAARAAEELEVAAGLGDPAQVRAKYETLEDKMAKLSESLRAFVG